MPYPEATPTPLDELLAKLGQLNQSKWDNESSLPMPPAREPARTTNMPFLAPPDGSTLPEPRVAPQGPSPLSPPPPGIESPVLGQPGPSGAIPGAPLPRVEAERQIRLAAAEQEAGPDPRLADPRFGAVPEDSPMRGRGYVPPAPSNPEDAYTPVAAQDTEPAIPNAQGPSPSVPMPTQSVEPSQGYDPIRILQDKYGSSIRDIASAREHDLTDMQMQRKLMLLNSMGQHAAGNQGAAAAFGAGAAKLSATPLMMESYQKQAEVEKLMSESQEKLLSATKATWEMLPDSPLSKDARMAFVASPQFEDVAKNISIANGISLMDSRKELYNRSKIMSKVGMDAFISKMKESGDYSKQRMEEANTYAEKVQRDAVTRQLGVETKQKETIYAAMGDGHSLSSVMGKESIIRSYGLSVKTIYEQQTGKKWADATLTEIAAFDPTLAAHALQVIQFQIETERANERKRYVSPEIEVKEVPGAGPEGSTLGQIRNYADVSPQEANEYALDVQAAKEGYRYGLQAQHYLSTGKPKGAKDIIFQTGDGGRLVNALQKLKAYSGRLAPKTQEALQSATTALGDGITVRNSVFNSAKAVVDQAVMELSGNLQARSAKFVPSGPYVNSFKNGPPSVPPVMLPHEVFQENIKGKNMRGLRFNQIGPSSNVKYYLNPETGQWFDPKVGG